MSEGSNQFEKPATSGESQSDGKADARRSARRRLLKTGLVAAPILMTLRGRPAHAQSLGSLGTFYGLYDPKTGKEVIPDPNGKGKMQYIPDPNGPDRRPNTGDEP